MHHLLSFHAMYILEIVIEQRLRLVGGLPDVMHSDVMALRV